MGTRMASSYANIFMKYRETQLLDTSTMKPKIWFRFIDDIIMIWHHDRNDLENFINLANNLHPTIKFSFTINNQEIPFLDTVIYRGKNNYMLSKQLKYTQRYAARLACNKTKRDSAQDCMKILQWLPIEFRTKFKLLTIVFKTLQGNGPSYLQTKLNTMTYQRTTRRSTTKGITLKAPYNKKKTQDDPGFTYTAVTHWNRLPEYIRQSEDISSFKRLLKHITLN